MALPWPSAFASSLATLLSAPQSESLRPTDESHHHQQRLARRLEVARAISGSWTLSRDPANIAEKLVDGSYDALRTYVAGPEGQEASTSGAVDTRDAADLSYEEFWLQYMFPNRPVMIRNVGKQWRATREWVTSEGSVNAKFLSETFGEAKVWVTHCAPLAGDSGEKSAGEREQWTLAEYLDYFTTKDEDPRLLYLKDWHFPYEFSHYKAYETPEYFREDWLNEYYDYSQSQRKEGERSQQTIESSDYRFVYLGPEGTKTGLHADVLRSYSWSINIVSPLLPHNRSIRHRKLTLTSVSALSGGQEAVVFAPASVHSPPLRHFWSKLGPVLLRC